MQVSPALDKVRKKYVVEPVRSDGRTNFDEDILLGKHFNAVINQVIEEEELILPERVMD